jgi:hypothetical protein
MSFVNEPKPLPSYGLPATLQTMDSKQDIAEMNHRLNRIEKQILADQAQTSAS